MHARMKSRTKDGKGQEAATPTAENQMEDEGKHPPPLLPPGCQHFHAPRLIALRGGDRNEETPATEKKNKNAYSQRLRT